MVYSFQHDSGDGCTRYILFCLKQSQVHSGSKSSSDQVINRLVFSESAVMYVFAWTKSFTMVISYTKCVQNMCSLPVYR